MKLSHDLLNDLREAVIQVTDKHQLIMVVQPVTTEDWLSNEVEFTFTLAEMSDKELEDSKCG